MIRVTPRPDADQPYVFLSPQGQRLANDFHTGLAGEAVADLCRSNACVMVHVRRGIGATDVWRPMVESWPFLRRSWRLDPSADGDSFGYVDGPGEGQKKAVAGL
jgi:hypothetical protein